jgi:hypothetical protein
MEEVVIFRKWLNNKVLALFPEDPVDKEGRYCFCYEPIGEPESKYYGLLVGAEDYTTCIRRTKPATPEEYGDLKARLERVGYKLRLKKRISGKSIAARMARANCLPDPPDALDGNSLAELLSKLFISPGYS